MSKIYIHLLIIACSVFLGYKATDLHWSSKWLKAEAEASQNQLQKVNAIVAVHNKRVREFEEMNRETENELEKARIAANDATTDADRLRQQFTDSLRRQSTCNSNATVAELAAEATTRTVQAELFGISIKAASDYAKIADEARIRGLSCESQYQILVKEIK